MHKDKIRVKLKTRGDNQLQMKLIVFGNII